MADQGPGGQQPPIAEEDLEIPVPEDDEADAESMIAAAAAAAVADAAVDSSPNRSYNTADLYGPPGGSPHDNEVAATLEGLLNGEESDASKGNSFNSGSEDDDNDDDDSTAMEVADHFQGRTRRQRVPTQRFGYAQLGGRPAKKQQVENKEQVEKERTKKQQHPTPATVRRSNTSNSSEETAKRKSPPSGSTTATKNSKKKKKRDIRISKGKRVWTTRGQIANLITDPVQERIVAAFNANNHRLFGLVISGGSRDGYKVSFDVFPNGHKHLNLVRGRLELVKPGEEETQDSNYEETLEVIQGDDELVDLFTKKKPLTPYQQSVLEFLKKPNEEIKSADSFDMRYDKGSIKWKIFADDEDIKAEDDPME